MSELGLSMEEEDTGKGLNLHGNSSHSDWMLGSSVSTWHELDGSQTLKSWGVGRNSFDAIEQAKKNAVNEVIFKGIRKGQAGCDTRPILVAGNAREKYRDYFFDFFVDKGPYLEYVSLKDESLMQKITSGWKIFPKKEVRMSVIVRVKRNKLRKKLMHDNLIKN